MTDSNHTRPVRRSVTVASLLPVALVAWVIATLWWFERAADDVPLRGNSDAAINFAPTAQRPPAAPDW